MPVFYIEFWNVYQSHHIKQEYTPLYQISNKNRMQKKKVNLFLRSYYFLGTVTFKYKTDFGEISVLSTEISNWKIKIKIVNNILYR
jgi:hypothetical protein